MDCTRLSGARVRAQAQAVVATNAFSVPRPSSPVRVGPARRSIAHTRLRKTVRSYPTLSTFVSRHASLVDGFLVLASTVFCDTSAARSRDVTLGPIRDSSGSRWRRSARWRRVASSFSRSSINVFVSASGPAAEFETSKYLPACSMQPGFKVERKQRGCRRRGLRRGARGSPLSRYGSDIDGIRSQIRSPAWDIASPLVTQRPGRRGP